MTPINTKKVYNTPNSAKRPIRCSNYRPCNRDGICDYCLNRRIKFICEQIKPLVNLNDMRRFVTLTLPIVDDPQSAMTQLRKVRPAYHEILKRAGPYLSVIAVDEKNNVFTPHFHSLAGRVDEKTFVKAFMSKARPYKFNLQIRLHKGNLVARANSRIGYMIKCNYRPTLRFKARRSRLLSSSRGIHLSKRHYITRFVWD